MKKRSTIMKDLSMSNTQDQLSASITTVANDSLTTIKGKVYDIETGDLVLNNLRKKIIDQLIIRGDEYTLTYDKDDKKIKNITSNTDGGSNNLLAVSLLFSSCIPLSGVSCNDEITLEMLDTNTFRIAFKRPDVFIYFVFIRPNPLNYEGKIYRGESLYNNYSGANFKNATFISTTFVGIDLTGADFRGAKFNSCIFENANLIGADFRDAVLEAVLFKRNTNLTGTNFSGATLEEITIEGDTIMKNTIFIDTKISLDSKIDANQTDVIR